MLAAGVKEMALTRYLIQQVVLSNEKRMEELREFIPNAKSEDWEIVVAGQRVQVIKDTPKGKGTLQFGTEVVSAADGSVVAFARCFPRRFDSCSRDARGIREVLPARYGRMGAEN